MANAFTNFLGGVVSGVFGTSAIMKDYQHADRLYVRDTYSRAPKVGFLYFVNFNVNLNAIRDTTRRYDIFYKDVGMLVKRIDQPKFQLETETINQYNRKTVIQKAIKYQPISIDFHDDNSDITRDLWKAYFQYYFADSNYGNTLSNNTLVPPFEDTKYKDSFYKYGLDNGQKEPFFKSINIYVLHQQKFTQYTLVNPLVTEWSHDTLEQSENSKTLTNKMSVAYETVLYNQGQIQKGTDVDQFRAFYDTTPSPLSIGGLGSKTLFGPGGVIAGAQGVFGSITQGNFLAAAIQANQLRRNARGITKASLQAETTNIIGNALSGVAASRARNTGDVKVAGVAGVNQYNTVARSVTLTKK
jgi:hypothetical protein